MSYEEPIKFIAGNYVAEDKVPLPPKDAKVFTTACDYCITGCGYKVYRWPVGQDGSAEKEGNAFDVDFPGAIQSGVWVSPNQHNTVTVDGKPHNIVVVGDHKSTVVNVGGDHSVRGGTIAKKCFNPDTLTRDRLQYPMVRINGELKRVSWNDALDIMAEVSKYVIEKRGRSAWAMKMYSYQYWENTHALTKLALRKIRTPAWAVHDQPTGHGPDTPGMADAGIDNFSASYEDWSIADVLYPVLPHKPIRQWVLSFPYPLRFLLSNNPQVMSSVLGIVNRAISTHLIKKAGFKAIQAQTGAVTLIQRFGSALNLNVHFHMLFIDGVYQEKDNGQLRFHRVNAATTSEINTLVATISQRVADHLERQGLLVRDDESGYLTLDLQSGDAMSQLQGHSITYRIAVGPQQGRKVFTLQTIPSWEDDDFGTNQVGKIAGFSLHAGVATKTRERKKLERLCRYISRPAASEKRLALTSQGNVRYQLKTPYRDGTTHVIFEPLDFMSKLAALVPKPRANLTRYHGVLAPNSKQRIFVTLAKRGKGNTQKQGVKDDEPALVDCHQSMMWAERLKRVFNIDITICNRCGGAVRIIACIEDPSVIKKVLAHLDAKSGTPTTVNQIPEPRAPPQESLFD